jgi:hypothetical protein
MPKIFGKADGRFRMRRYCRSAHWGDVVAADGEQEDVQPVAPVPCHVRAISLCSFGSIVALASTRSRPEGLQILLLFS